MSLYAHCILWIGSTPTTYYQDYTWYVCSVDTIFHGIYVYLIGGRCLGIDVFHTSARQICDVTPCHPIMHPAKSYHTGHSTTP